VPLSDFFPPCPTLAEEASVLQLWQKKRKAEREKYNSFEKVAYGDRERAVAIKVMTQFAKDEQVSFAEVCRRVLGKT
jgi:hypothetical protein